MGTSGSAGGGERGGKEFRRVEEALRKWLEDGTYPPGSMLPPQRQLSDEFGVSRDTVKGVQEKLAEEGWVSSRQGSGVRVLKAPSAGQPGRAMPGQPGRATPGPLIAAAFKQPHVSLDVYTLTSETLYGHVRARVEGIVSGRVVVPQSVSVRMMLPSRDAPLGYPRSKDRTDPSVWERFLGIARFYEQQMREVLTQLPDEVEVSLEIRTTPLTPQFKLYVFNDTEMLFGPYEVIEKELPAGGGGRMVPGLDVLGLSSVYTYFRRDEDEGSRDSQFFSSMQAWFESNWTLLGDDGTAG